MHRNHQHQSEPCVQQQQQQQIGALPCAPALRAQRQLHNSTQAGSMDDSRRPGSREQLLETLLQMRAARRRAASLSAAAASGSHRGAPAGASQGASLGPTLPQQPQAGSGLAGASSGAAGQGFEFVPFSFQNPFTGLSAAPTGQEFSFFGPGLLQQQQPGSGLSGGGYSLLPTTPSAAAPPSGPLLPSSSGATLHNAWLEASPPLTALPGPRAPPQGPASGLPVAAAPAPTHHHHQQQSAAQLAAAIASSQAELSAALRRVGERLRMLELATRLSGIAADTLLAAVSLSNAATAGAAAAGGAVAAPQRGGLPQAGGTGTARQQQPAVVIVRPAMLVGDSRSADSGEALTSSLSPGTEAASAAMQAHWRRLVAESRRAPATTTAGSSAAAHTEAARATPAAAAVEASAAVPSRPPSAAPSFSMEAAAAAAGPEAPPPPSSRRHPAADTTASSSASSCVICWAAPRRVLTLPCRHLCMCERCFSRLAVDAATSGFGFAGRGHTAGSPDDDELLQLLLAPDRSSAEASDEDDEDEDDEAGLMAALGEYFLGASRAGVLAASGAPVHTSSAPATVGRRGPAATAGGGDRSARTGSSLFAAMPQQPQPASVEGVPGVTDWGRVMLGHLRCPLCRAVVHHSVSGVLMV